MANDQIEVEAVGAGAGHLNLRHGMRAIVERTDQIDSLIKRGRLAIVNPPKAKKPAKGDDTPTDTLPADADDTEG